MADRICAVCGATNPPTVDFCRVCDAYFDWNEAQEAPAQATDEAPGETRDEAPAPATDAAAAAASPVGPPDEGSPGPGRDPRAAVPVATIGDATVVVAPGAPGTTSVSLKNASDIVDGIVIHPEAAPSWLVVTHEDARLMPGESRTVVVTFEARPGVLVVAQQLSLVLNVRSSVDAAKFTQVTAQLAVPRVGPRPTLTPRPALVHLQDETEGSFAVSFDNRAANFPRRYRLSAHDPEDLIGARFLPPVVDVPAGESVDVEVHFLAPAPEPGREVTRQLTVTGTGDEEPVSVTVGITQRAAALPERVPVVLRLEPSHLRSSGGETAVFDVLVDNRGSGVDAHVTLSGRDPQRLVGFAFGTTAIVVHAGTVATVRAHARTAPPPPGTTESRPFSVVATDGTSEVVAAGVLEVASRAAPITTARLRLEPANLAIQRQGAYLVHVDNREGADVLQVQLAGRDEFGKARLAFTPPVMTVPPGQVGIARLAVSSEPPPGGSTSSRRVKVTASDGRGAVEAEAVLTQTTPDRRPVAKRWLVVLGAVLASVGALLPWSGTGVTLNDLFRAAARAAQGDEDAIITTAFAGSTVLVLLLALLMLLGLNGSSGRGIRFAALLIAIAGVAAVVVRVQTAGPFLILLGAVLGFIGGVLARPTK